MGIPRTKLIEILSDYNFWGTYSKGLKERTEYELKLMEDPESQTVCVLKGI